MKMNIKQSKFFPERSAKYWDIHKEIYFDEFDSLDFEIREVITNNPHDSTTIRFNSKIDKMVVDQLQESDS